ncbi:uncharacterized LOC103187628 [Callorhinchus milii]|uniref:Type 11 methyltransferase n=1 Tax=Callorhinchus milii TaxID=7868 RepID=K4FYD0_CALMI|nr:uncharacterized LOC103187628 [Callorhinchus milii]AFK11212.1 type 11 methyltransferase [Callorhinchus milii]
MIVRNVLWEIKRGLLESSVLIVGGCTLYYLWKHFKELSRQKNEEENPYESQKLLSEYLLFHFGTSQEVFLHDLGPPETRNFLLQGAEECVKQFKVQSGAPSRALDIGCGVGRASFELAHTFQEVVGIDFSHLFITTCNQLKDKGRVSYSATMEGNLRTQYTAVVSEDIDRSRCTFIWGDACNLPINLGLFGCILASNLICRLPDPFAFFHRLPGLLAPGGILVIISPYSWMEMFTPKSMWLGRYTDDFGKAVQGFDTMKRVLCPDFELVVEKNMPFFMRETARKYQWTVAHMTVWRRKRS